MNVAVLFYPAKGTQCYGTLSNVNNCRYSILIGRRGPAAYAGYWFKLICAETSPGKFFDERLGAEEGYSIHGTPCANGGTRSG